MEHTTLTITKHRVNPLILKKTKKEKITLKTLRKEIENGVFSKKFLNFRELKAQRL